MKIVRTWKEVAQKYSEDNPNDQICSKTAVDTHNTAVDKIRSMLSRNHNMRDDLIEHLTKRIKK
jgi:hypothetical protein